MRASVSVPATSANLGPGFDTFGLALDIRNVVTIDTGAEPRVTWALEGAEELPTDGSDLISRTIVAVAARMQEPLPAFALRGENHIPLARGLGSSAAATIAGVVAANALMGGLLDQETQLRIATGIEGHPDNAAAALLGGFVVSASTADGVEAVRFDIPRDLRVVLFIPELRLSTAAMRKALPKSVPLADAVANLGAVGVGVAGLAAGRTDLLARMTVDRLHEPYRAKVFPELPRLVAAAREAGALGACLSGAGSTVMAFVDSMTGISRVEGAFAAAAADTDLEGRILVVEPRNAGARVVSTT